MILSIVFDLQINIPKTSNTKILITFLCDNYYYMTGKKANTFHTAKSPENYDYMTKKKARSVLAIWLRIVTEKKKHCNRRGFMAILADVLQFPECWICRKLPELKNIVKLFQKNFSQRAFQNARERLKRGEFFSRWPEISEPIRVINVIINKFGLRSN